MRLHPLYKHCFLVMITEHSRSITILITGCFCLLMADRTQSVVSADSTCKKVKISKQLKVEQKLKSNKDNCISISAHFHMKLQLV